MAVTLANLANIYHNQMTQETFDFLTTVTRSWVDLCAANGLTEALQTHVQYYLIAHLDELRQRAGNKAVNMGQITETKEIPGMNIQTTSWGQTACTLDTTGTLQSLGMEKPELFIVEGC